MTERTLFRWAILTVLLVEGAIDLAFGKLIWGAVTLGVVALFTGVSLAVAERGGDDPGA